MNHTYIIGEIGQNHNGDVNIAKKIIDIITEPVIDTLFGEKLQPMDAVKLTKRDLKEELSQSAMLKPYTGPNSFGKTYGEHREFLELNDEEHYEIYKYAKAKGLSYYKVITKHALKNAINPVITAVSGWFASLMAGAFFIEYIFHWQGIGKLTIDALNTNDLPVILGACIFIGLIFVLLSIVTDVLYRVLDPRMRN